MSDKYRLIWFQHLQKAAGSSIIRMALLNGETLYPNHRNGNPHTADGKEIRLWEMERSELIDFIDQCEDKGVTFVATEKAAPPYSVIASDPRVCFITCLRDPLSRFMSHFYYLFYRGDTDVSSPEQFVNSIFISTMSNYYCRIFSGFNNDPNPIGRQQYEIAKSTLRSFDCCIVLEKTNPFAELFEVLHWKDKELKENQTRLNIQNMVKSVARGRIRLLSRRVLHPRKEPSEEFMRTFKEENNWDYRLYEKLKLKALS